MGKLCILGPNGHSEVKWNFDAATKGDVEAIASVREAERIVIEAWGRKNIVLRVDKGKPARRMHGFDPKAEEIVIIPRIAGG